MPGREPYERERSRLGALLGTKRQEGVEGLRALEESRARELLELPLRGEIHLQVPERLPSLTPNFAREVLDHLKAAEEQQWEIGTWATSGGEGIASMAEVYSLKLAQAWMWIAIGEIARARSLADEVAADPNNLGEEFFKESIADLRRRARTSTG